MQDIKVEGSRPCFVLDNYEVVRQYLTVPIG